MREAEWMTMKDTLRRIYLDLNQKRSNTLAILTLVHSFPTNENDLDRAIRKYNLKVNKGKEDENEERQEGRGGVSKPRERLRKLQNQGVGEWFELLRDAIWRRHLKAALVDRYYSSAVPVIRSPDAYLFQERMLASVHSYIFSLFKTGAWSFNSTAMLDPTGATCADGVWKGLSDQVWGAGSLVRQGYFKEGITKLNCTLLDMETVVHITDPQLMVRIWRICRYLHGICSSLNEQAYLKTHFLINFRDLLRGKKGEESPVCQLFDALSRMDADCLLWALRIGQLRALQSFESIIGPGHPLVLSMWIYYSKQWQVAGDHYSTIVEYYEAALNAADLAFDPMSDTALSILHDFTYFVYYSDDNRTNEQEVTLATHLFNRTWPEMSKGTSTWNNKAQYFAFASQILARYWAKQGHRIWAREYVENATALLQNSDRECQVRASMLLGQLRRWLVQWGELEEARHVEERQLILKRSVADLLKNELEIFLPEDREPIQL